MKEAFLARIREAAPHGRSLALATSLGDGRQSLVDERAAEGDLSLDADALAAVREALRADRSRTIDAAGERIFVQVFSPKRRCFVVGAVHIAQPLARMLALADYAVTVIDPRAAFATELRFPGVELASDWPDEALDRLKPDHRSAVVTLTHDPKLDDPALASALRSACFYIGALGSRKTHASRCARLTEQGFGPDDLARIHGPIGLAIGAVSPAEIAVSILSQITQVLRQGEMRGAESSG